MLRLLLLLIIVPGCIAVAAQSPTPSPSDETDVQSWHDISISRAINKKVDVVIPFTFRFGKNVTRLNEGRAGIGLALKPHSRITISPTYQFIRARNTAGGFARENRISIGATFKLPVQKVGLSHRSLFEYRIRQTSRSWRYRPSITIDKELPERWIKGAKVYVTEDPFYDSAAGRLSRNRLSFGINKVISDNLSLDLYYLRQDDRNSTTSLIHVIGTHWRIRL